MNTTVLYNIITIVILPYSIGEKQVTDRVHTKSEGLHKDISFREQGSWGPP